MAAPYAALVSLHHVLNRIQHPRCPVSFDQSQIQSLLDKANFLIDFLEQNDTQRISKLTEGLEREIVDAAHAAEDFIESYFVYQIHPESSRFDMFLKNEPKLNHKRGSIKKSFMEHEQNVYALLCKNLIKVTQHLDFITDHVINIKEEMYVVDRLPIFSKPIALPVSDHSRIDTMVGFDEDLKSLMNQLTSHDSTRRIISIVGMGGIGKTTLARNTYNHVCNHFDVQAWVTVSQNYNVKEIFLCILHNIGDDANAEKSIEELGEQLHKFLSGRKYLIILDDIWSGVVWDIVMRYLPDDNNRSRIMLSTRLLNVALRVGSHGYTYKMKFLDDDTSWVLLSKKVFGEKYCPPEFEELGKQIAKSCKGLPLTIVVIGGLLKNSSKSPNDWESIAKNMNFDITSENNENCLNVLSLSYNHLPIHLKPCFLYLATFPKDFQIRVSELIPLWVADGFLKPIVQKTLEEVALECLNDLIGRNLIMVEKRGYSGKIKYCSVHDLVMDLCLREAQNERFLCLIKGRASNGYPQGVESERRIVTHKVGDVNTILPVLPSKSLARSFISNSHVPPKFAHEPMLLRVCSLYCENLNTTISQLFNARLVIATPLHVFNSLRFLPSSISLFWNLETFIVKNLMLETAPTLLPSEIWELPHIRHLVFTGTVIFQDIAGTTHIDCVLHNLQTLSTVVNFSGTYEVVKRIPNLKKLGIYYDMNEDSLSQSEKVRMCFNNLAHLHKLEKLKCTFQPISRNCVFNQLETLNFPSNLKRLTLLGSMIPWENMKIVGTIRNLEVLKLEENAFWGQEWDSSDGEFQQLKCLSIENCLLVTWRAESSHFPRLEHLDLYNLKLKEIPASMGEVDTLESIKLELCLKSVIISAMEILDEQQMLGNDDLLIHVTFYTDNPDQEVMSLSNNFQVRRYRSNERRGGFDF